jgi:hypothetical protein
LSGHGAKAKEEKEGGDKESHVYYFWMKFRKMVKTVS